MASPALLTVRYPSGDIEYRTHAHIPTIGEVVAFRGHKWRVEHVEETAKGTITVTLRPTISHTAPPLPGSDSGSGLTDALDRRAARFHERAAKLHDDAAKLQAEHEV